MCVQNLNLVTYFCPLTMGIVCHGSVASVLAHSAANPCSIPKLFFLLLGAGVAQSV
jgi:hypothetical protein